MCAAPAEESQIETIEIPQDSVGLVIGKKGASIKEFETKSGAKIKVASNEENKGKAERTVTIEGICSARNYAKGLVYETLEIAAGVTADQKKGAGKQGSDFIFHISNDAIGLLIGKGGSTIKNIENSFGVRVQIDKTTPAGATKRQITLVGNPAGAKMAKAQIESIVSFTFGCFLCVPGRELYVRASLLIMSARALRRNHKDREQCEFLL